MEFSSQPMLKENRPTQLPFSFRSKWHAAEVYIWIVLLIFGIGACLILPISGGYDEETHLMRAWQISGFQFLPNADKNGKMPFPAVYWEMSYRRQVLVTAVEPGLWQKYGQLAMDAHDYIYGSVDTRSVYSPPLLIPQAIVLRWLGRSERLPALPVYYLCRLVGLFSYLLLVWLGVRLIPFGKWIFAILATSPVMILQASTISADAISNGIAWLFIGGVLASAAQKDLHWKQWLQLVILIFVLFWGKLNIIPLVILPFLLLRPAQFKIKHGYILLITITVVLFLVEVVGWNSLAYSQLHTAPDGTSPIGQVKFILSHPITFVSILDKDIIIHGGKYLQNWIAIYGFNYWPVPAWTYYLYGFGVVCALFVKPESIDRRTRFILLFVFAITYLFTITSLYLTFNPVGSPSIDGVQGRYFGTVMPLLFLALAGIQFQKPLLIPNALPILFGVLSLTLYLVGMYLSYHVPCGSQYYQLGLCYQPNYKNWSPDALYSPPLNTSLTLAQEIVPTCNGMSQIRVWTNAVGSDPAGSTEFIVKDMQQNKVVVDTHSTNSALPQGDWFTVNFKPDWSSQGKFYLLTLRSEVSGPRFAYSLKPEYPAGKLFENDQALDQDIIFQTGCIAGLEKLRLPNSP